MVSMVKLNVLNTHCVKALSETYLRTIFSV